jgi:hypothetical protein
VTARLEPDQMHRPVEPGDHVVALDGWNRTITGEVVSWQLAGDTRRVVVADPTIGEVVVDVIVSATLLARARRPR